MLFASLVACIDKWVNSKFEDATPPALCSGPKLAIWNKNQPPRPEKTPGHGEKSKMAILVLFGSRRSLGEKETDLYNDSCPTVFNLYDIHTPQTPLDIIQTLPDTPQTPPYLAFMRPLGERVISDHHNIYSTGFNF